MLGHYTALHNAAPVLLITTAYCMTTTRHIASYTTEVYHLLSDISILASQLYAVHALQVICTTTIPLSVLLQLLLLLLVLLLLLLSLLLSLLLPLLVLLLLHAVCCCRCYRARQSVLHGQPLACAHFTSSS
jgi:hypothetical protein